MSTTDAGLALRYLADGGFTPIGPDRWRCDGTLPEEMSDEDVAFHTAFEITTDEGLDVVQRVRTGFGLLDLTAAFEVLIHLNAYVVSSADPAVADAIWAGFRDRMAVPEPIENLRGSAQGRREPLAGPPPPGGRDAKRCPADLRRP